MEYAWSIPDADTVRRRGRVTVEVLGVARWRRMGEASLWPVFAAIGLWMLLSGPFLESTDEVSASQRLWASTALDLSFLGCAWVAYRYWRAGLVLTVAGIEVRRTIARNVCLPWTELVDCRIEPSRTFWRRGVETLVLEASTRGRIEVLAMSRPPDPAPIRIESLAQEWESLDDVAPALLALKADLLATPS
jgi:hypothetical protein